MDTEITLHESTERQPFTEWLGDVLGKLKGEKLDIAALIYNRIQEEEKPKSAFQYFLENADEIDSTEEKEPDQVFTATEIQRLKKKCEPLIEGVLESLLSENISTEDFYGRLWEDGICGNTTIILFCRRRRRRYMPYTGFGGIAEFHISNWVRA